MKTTVTKAGEPKQVSLTTLNRSLERVRTGSRYAKKFGRPASWCFAHARVHDLLHTFGRRLRATGVSEETRKVLLGHRNGDITTHYSAAELAELITAVNEIDRSLETPAITLLRTAA